MSKEETGCCAPVGLCRRLSHLGEDYREVVRDDLPPRRPCAHISAALQMVGLRLVIVDSAFYPVRHARDAGGHPMVEIERYGTLRYGLTPVGCDELASRITICRGRSTYVCLSGRETLSPMSHNAFVSCKNSHGLAAKPPTRNTIYNLFVHVNGYSAPGHEKKRLTPRGLPSGAASFCFRTASTMASIAGIKKDATSLLKKT